MGSLHLSGCMCFMSVSFIRKEERPAGPKSGGGGGLIHHNIGNISVLNHKCEPMDITQATCKLYAGEHLNFSQFNIAESESKKKK